MDRSLVEMESGRPVTVRSRGVGTTVTKQTTSPRTGTVARLLHWQNIQMKAGDMAALGSIVPMQLVCTRQTMPAADVTRNRPSQRPFVNQAINKHARQGVQRREQ